MILSDPTHAEYDEFDYKLVKAHFLKKNFMAGDYPVWIDRSDRVSFEVKSFISNSGAAVERKMEQDEKANGNKNKYGKRYYAVPVLKYGEDMPTMREYLEQEAAKRGHERPGPPRGRRE